MPSAASPSQFSRGRDWGEIGDEPGRRTSDRRQQGHQDLRPLPCARQRRPGGQERRVPHPAGPVRLGQDDAADGARRLHPARFRQRPVRRPRGGAPGAAQARRRHGLPELRAVPAHGRRRQHRLSAAPARRRQGRDRRPRGAGAGDGQARRLRLTADRPAFRRPAPARRPGARHRVRAAHPVAGRAAVGARQAAARAHADRAAPAARTSSA